MRDDPRMIPVEVEKYEDLKRKAAAVDWFARTPEGRRIRAELLSVLRDGRDSMALWEVFELAKKAEGNG